ncbi:MAG: helix-turn-helix domain containing protein [Actinomycetota bacterium]|nr:helix-turn-helix domain containing protein [Actinomycetota bacterium]
MARWKPNAPERLAEAALELFAERGYDATTVAEIAERAGLTKSTFFRYFADKREVLFGGLTLDQVLAAGIAAAPSAATPLEAVANAFEGLGSDVFTPDRRPFSRRRQAVIAANPELQEREALKGLRISAAMVEALEQRGVPVITARVAAQVASLSLTMAYARWSEGDEDFGDLARRSLTELRAASASC